jgi:hypothetical protein
MGEKDMLRNTRRAVVLSAVCYMTLGVSVAQAGFPAAPTISKAFSPTSIASGGTSTITLTLTLFVGSAAQTNGSFSDTLANMAISGAQVAGGSCVGASSNNFANGATALNFTGLTIPAGGTCTVTVLVTSSTVGVNPNTTSGVTTTQSAPSGGAKSNTATLTVTPSTPVRLQSFDVN